MQKLVVGIDGSEGSQNALRWAIDEAGRRDATVEALHAWQPLLAAGLYSGAVFTDESVQEAGEKVLDDAIAAADPGGSGQGGAPMCHRPAGGSAHRGRQGC